MVDPTGDRDPTAPGADWAQAEWVDLIRRLSARKGVFDRYTVQEEVGRGGMGLVVHVRDEELHRDLAMKVMQGAGLEAGQDPSTPSMLAARFVEEAQVGGQLDHPGIVPVHEMGLDPEGRFYFTMKLVRGRTFEQVLDAARAGREDWSLTRSLHVLLRVCEAMGYAHERGVLHRDLKPANVMLGGHGEVYVMDWGLARVGGRPERVAADRSDGAPSPLHSARSAGSASGGSSPFVTEADRVVGTPAFMSPEQSAGTSTELTQQSDVYSVGAMLYAVLTGCAPYSQPGKRPDNRAAWVALQHGPPPSVASLARDVAPELVSICEKAMARDLNARYPSMRALADDLSAFLELRVVRAHRTGPWHEFKKWVLRNKAVACSALALVTVVTAAGFWVGRTEHARAMAMELQAEAGEATRLAALGSKYVSFPPARLAEAERWLERARYFASTRARREAEQESLVPSSTARAAREPDRQLAGTAREEQSVILEMEKDLARLEAAKDAKDAKDKQTAEEKLRTAKEIYPAELNRRRRLVAELTAAQMPGDVLRFADPKLTDEYQTRDELLAAIRRLEWRIPRVSERVDAVRRLPDQTLVEARAAWDEACASIADRSRAPAYAGLVVKPQLGLVPLRQDPASGLWEFWHVLSGRRPELGADGRWHLGADTGIVLVLVPGGEVVAGAQAQDPDQPRFDEDAHARERVRHGRLAPYFIAKYELTQGQTLWISGQNPSQVVVGLQAKDTPRTSGANPVENISWHLASSLLESVGLCLPTELQWEHAARAGGDGRFGSSDDFEDVRHRLNYADAAVGRNTKLAHDAAEDGYFTHARADAFEPNAFGLHCVLGNVSEWCQDWYEDNLSGLTARAGDGLFEPKIERFKSLRGGSYLNVPLGQRLSARKQKEPFDDDVEIGLRAARALDP